METAILILNWNGRELLADCLTSVFNQSHQNFTAYLIDNGSTDQSVQFVKQNFPQVKLVELPRNLGNAGGRNTAIKKVLQDNPNVKYFITLDNDARPNKDCFKQLIAKAVSDKTIGIVTSKLLSGNPPSIQNTGIVATDNLLFEQQNAGKSINSCNQSQEVLAPCTACALIKKTVFKQISLFDEEMFIYQDDVEFGIRAQLASWQTFYEPTAIAFHLYSATNRHQPYKISFYTVRNAILIGFQYYSWKTFWRKFLNLRKRKRGNNNNPTVIIVAIIAAFLLLPKALIKRYKLKKWISQKSA
ncbi:MAG: glycosyltransferase family 2 protein [Patescibacteria group bacterium]